jgi:hypothetical protein
MDNRARKELGLQAVTRLVFRHRSILDRLVERQGSEVCFGESAGSALSATSGSALGQTAGFAVMSALVGPAVNSALLSCW